MPWISRNSALTQEEMENNADIAIAYYTDLAIEENTIAALLGNAQAESTINPGRYEGGVGPGYGIFQWTPRSALIEHASNMGIGDYANGDNQLTVMNSEITGNPSVNNSWYTTEAFISPYYNSGATSDMIGITGQQFLSNSMGWTADKLAVLFMAARLRPSYEPDTNHWESRVEFSENWLAYIGGHTPSPKPVPDWDVSKWIQYGAVAESIRLSRKRRLQT